MRSPSIVYLAVTETNFEKDTIIKKIGRAAGRRNPGPNQ